MGELLIPLYFVSSMYNGIYLDHDTGKYYQLDKKQAFVGKKHGTEEPIYRPTIKNKIKLTRSNFEQVN